MNVGLSEASAEVAKTDSFRKGNQLHGPGGVPPHMWCIAKQDLRNFKKDVFRAWKEGEVLEDPLHPNPRHDERSIGPTMYVVNKCYIMPVTAAAGGMSYALMLHEEGLECDIFVTHAWAEGVFEFCDKVLHAWHHKTFWCCFLANPQNLDISAYLMSLSSVHHSRWHLVMLRV